MGDNNMDNEIVALLQRSANEIKALRNENQIMSARLGMFDNIMSLFNASKNQQGGMYAPDVVYEIEKEIACAKEQGGENS